MKLPTAHEALSDISVARHLCCRTSVQNPPRLSCYSGGPTGGRSKGVASLLTIGHKSAPRWPCARPYIVSGLWGRVAPLVPHSSWSLGARDS